MEDSFKVRVDKIFGSLASSSSSSFTTSPSSASSLRSLWCLTDDEIERKEWSRDKESPEPSCEPNSRANGFGFEKGPIDYREELEKDLEELGDELGEEEELEPRGSSGLSSKPDDYNDEEWEIKSSIGRDCTLDYEEEEDTYDRVAVGREKAGDRLYMSNMTDYGIDIDHDNELPTSFRTVSRDPRANHMAARIRLKEDAEAAGKIDNLHVSQENAHLATNVRVHTSEDDANLKSILKRKDGQSDSKTQKRVRFATECIEEASAGAEIVPVEPSGIDGPVTANSEFSSAVPDYIRNPSRYTHYTCDSSNDVDVDEQSNRQAYMDFLNTLRKSKATEELSDDSSGDLPSSITFIPRKRGSDGTILGISTELKQDQEDKSKEVIHRKGTPVGIAAEDAQDGEVCAMEEDGMEEAADKRNSLLRAGRHYRTKNISEDDSLYD